jgi:DNA-binding NtrC family response regulator
MTERILCVDDEPHILEAFQRQFRKQFAIETAVGGERALAAIAEHGPFAVVVSDLRMPDMDGIRLLNTIRERTPETVRILLTGHADLQAAIEAVNEGHVFRFLTKPCPSKTLAKALEAGLAQYRLITAEKALLEQTVSGSLKALSEVLGLVNPEAFGRSSRISAMRKPLRLRCRCPTSGA